MKDKKEKQMEKKKGKMEVTEKKIEVAGNEYTVHHLTDGLEEMVDDLLDKNKSYVLFGNPGTGKTYSLHQIKKRIDTIGLNIQSVHSLVRYTALESIETAKRKVLDSIEYCGYIIIDDLGHERINIRDYNDKYTMMEELICDTIYPKWEEYRGSDKEPKVYITSSRSLDELLDIYGSMTMCRLLEMCTFIDVDTEDLRTWPTDEFIKHLEQLNDIKE